MSTSIELTGIVHAIGAVQNVTDKFSKRELILHIDRNDTHSQHIPIQASQNNIDKLSGIREGDEIRVACNLRGRLYHDKKTGEEKTFMSLDMWKVEKLNSNPNTSDYSQIPQASQPTQQHFDDVPF